MPTINISGQKGSDPKSNKDAAWNAYEKSQSDAQKKAADMDAAFGKKENEAKSRRLSEMEALWNQQRQQLKSRIAEDTKLFNQEIKARTENLNLELNKSREAKRQASVLRQIEKKIETAEQQKYNNMRRAADEDNRNYNLQKRFRERQEAAVRRNDPNTYRAENVSRLGVMGMRAAERNDWRGLHRSERELGQIQRRFGHHPGVAAALAQARGRISAGGEGNPGWMMSLGRMSGAFSEMGALEGSGFLLGGGAGAGVAAGAYAAFKTGKAVLDAPMTISNYAQGMLGVAQPYMGLRSQLSAMGRASDSVRPGTLNSMDLENAFRPTGANGNWLQKYGLSRGTSAQLLGQYGIVPDLAEQGVNAVHSIARTAYNTGMDPALIASMGGSAANLGMTDKNGGPEFSLDEYLKKVERITTTAVSQGMDKSQATNILDGLYKQSTNANTATLGNGSSISDLWTRMMQAGTPSGRSGASAASMVAGAQTFAQDIGFDTQNPARAQIMASYIQRHGGPKAFGSGGDELRKLIGDDRYKILLSTPGGKETLRRINEAAASGNAGLLMNTMVPVMGDPETVQRAIGGSYLQDQPKGPWGDLSKQNAAGASAQATNDYNATKGFNLDAATAAGDDSTTGRARRLYTLIRHQGWDARAAADMVANALTEAPGLDPHAHNELGGGHHGLFQLGTARQKLFLEHMGFAITDPRATMEKQAEFNDWELHNSEKTAGNLLKKGQYIPGFSVFSRFDERPGNGDVEAANRGALGDRIGPQLEASYQAVKSNSNADVNRINSQTGELATGAAQTEFDRLNSGAKVLGDMLVNVSSGAEKLNAAFFQLATTVGTLNGSLSRGGGSSTGMPGPYDSRTLGKG